MTTHDFLVGEEVFIFSESLDEIIPCKIIGFSGENRTRVRTSQGTPDGIIIHLVSWIYVFRDSDSAEIAAEEYRLSKRVDQNLSTGNTVYLKQDGGFVTDEDDNPYLYQIIRMNHKRGTASLVDTNGDLVGDFDFKDIEFFSEEPIFKSSDYYLGQIISWIEGDDVYEGTISLLSHSTALITNIKKLLPLDKKKYLPYYKIQSENLYNKILTYVIGDEIDSE